MRPLEPQRAPFAVLAVAAAVIGLLGIAFADRSGPTADSILEGMAGPLAGASRVGDVLERTGGHLFARSRLLILLAVTTTLLVLRRFKGSDGVSGLFAALVVAAIGHSLLMEGRIAPGIALYGVAAAVYAVRAPRRIPEQALSGWIEAPVGIALLTLYAALALHRLDVYPQVFLDEMAYQEAARMLLGELRAEDSTVFAWLGYSFDRFQAQFIPLSIHAAAVSLLSPDILSLRLTSFLALGAALIIAAATLRRRVGPRAALWMLALAGLAPQYLTYSRTGFYIAICVLHSVLCFAATLRLRETGSRAVAIQLGMLLGASLYLYQLSWFVPILVAGSLVAGAPNVEQRPKAPALLLVAAVVAATSLPAVLVLRSSFGAVAEQTFDYRAVWTDERGHRPRVVMRIRESLQERDIEALRRRLPYLRLRLRVIDGDSYTTTLQVIGVPEVLDKAVPQLESESWQLLTGYDRKSLATNVQRMSAALLYAPSRQLGRWIPPLVPPLLAPLAFLGVLEAIRRRREPVMQLLLIWVVVGALLPGALGRPLPRRSVLIWPFVAALPALALVALGQGLATRHWIGRVAAVLLAGLLYAGVALTGVNGYFAHPEQGTGVSQANAAALEAEFGFEP